MKKKEGKTESKSSSRKWLIGSLVVSGIGLVVLFSILIYATPDEQYREPAGVNAANTDARLNSEDPEANYFGKYAPPEEHVAPAPETADTVKKATTASSDNNSSGQTAAEPAKVKTEPASPSTSETAAPKNESQPKKQQPAEESLFD